MCQHTWGCEWTFSCWVADAFLQALAQWLVFDPYYDLHSSSNSTGQEFFPLVLAILLPPIIQVANSALHPSKCYWHSLQPRWPRITADSGDSGLILNRSWWCSRNTLPCVCTERLKLASAGHHCISVQGVSPEIQAQRIEAHHYTSHFFLFRNQQPSTYEVWTLRFHVSYVSSLGLPRHDGSVQKKKVRPAQKRSSRHSMNQNMP